MNNTSPQYLFSSDAHPDGKLHTLFLDANEISSEAQRISKRTRIITLVIFSIITVLMLGLAYTASAKSTNGELRADLTHYLALCNESKYDSCTILNSLAQSNN